MFECFVAIEHLFVYSIVLRSSWCFGLVGTSDTKVKGILTCDLVRLIVEVKYR